ncbi:Heterokaryon incompatibility protein 6, OR allele [Madurella mycetomatis]|uniref:Heterokaryon incompatibility protein 6, OR allele n=1 Tax=Madurella mycetomatis TaxID=100816 RepID=A0A175W8Z2_9PEZI|nr:Heterokaryon incompatibility protein 6, OR allele [Madurella mycetomatis]
MSPYKYCPLPPSHIRLLELHPSADPVAPLKASVLTVALLSLSAPLITERGDRDELTRPKPPAPAATAPFEALSYAWGDPATPSTLHITDGTAVPITASLSSLLARIRRPDAPRTVWADAVCINQRDPAEKAVQVGMMDVIYSAAERVLADLGEDDGGCGMMALRVMGRYWRVGLEQGVDRNGFGRTLTTPETLRMLGIEDEVGLGDSTPTRGVAATADPVEGAEEEQRGAAGRLDFTDDERLAVLKFFERPWFRRIWIMQEFVLAREVVMFYGRHKINWRHLFASCFVYEGIPMITQAVLGGDLNQMAGMMNYFSMAWIRRLRTLEQTESGRQFVDYLAALSDGRMMRYYRKPSLAQLLHYLRMSHATLRRDRYFALLKISSDVDVEEHPELRPDYTAPDHEIVRRFAKVLIQKDGAAEALMRAGLWRQMEPKLPSWAEDATQDNSTFLELTMADSTHKAAGDTEFIAWTDPNSPNTITVKGFRADTIQEPATSWQDVVSNERERLWAAAEYLHPVRIPKMPPP